MSVSDALSRVLAMPRALAESLVARTRAFRGASQGSVSVELILTLPLLLWALAATVVFYDGYKTRYHAQMAAQTVADIMSRETDLFTANYIEGLNDVFDFLIDSRFPTRLRVSSVIWDSANERNRLQWSYATRDLSALPEDTFELMQAGDLETLMAEFGEDGSFTFAGAGAQMPVSDLPDRIPPVLPGEALLLVEAFALWEPFAQVGVGQLRFTPVVVVRPRFAPWINFEGQEPVYPEADYEIAWTGSGNEGLPDPTDPTPEPTNPPVANRTYSFDDGVTSGLSRSTITAGGPSGSYLGPFGTETWTTPVTVAVDLQADHATANIAFDLLILDTWDGYANQYILPRGDTFTILMNGVPLSVDPFINYSQAPYDNARVSTGYIGNSTYRVSMTRTRTGSSFAGGGSNDQLWRVTLTIDNAPRTFSLGLSAGVDSAISDESWGLDNLTITASNVGTGTAAPFVANAANLLTADPHNRFNRYSGCPEYRIAAPWLTMTRADLTTGITMQRQASGGTSLSSCPNTGGWGYANASPSLVLNYDNQNVTSTYNGLQIRLNDGNSGYTCDTTLIIRDPNGQWYFNDDYTGWNAGVRMTNPPSGQYVIFIGTYNRGSCNTNLTIDRWTR
ncbi:hypothetical protein [Pararhodobacter aggregans]|uniref:Uncharacterized protein n=1 Tax=Pararhodobacter aggregans TaxID=404875 RepID=A0A2T7UR38_9RHOB|nr:hypothetical protein [Pararhodobacter aggregans]PTX01852.1 hypothetical protein C8N33_10670 [Pararhodobacter aggregans]PVE47051.1 hypothetical protein DDE23_12395 [Pararhodobacter aggregans]